MSKIENLGYMPLGSNGTANQLKNEEGQEKQVYAKWLMHYCICYAQAASGIGSVETLEIVVHLILDTIRLPTHKVASRQEYPLHFSSVLF